MGKFLLFSGDQYYPSGGWRDYDGTFNTSLEAITHAVKLGNDWFHILDTETNKIVYEKDNFY